MNNILNEFRKRFSTRETRVDAYDEEALWANIVEELDASPQRRFIVNWRYAALILLALMSGMAYYQHRSTGKETVATSPEMPAPAAPANGNPVALGTTALSDENNIHTAFSGIAAWRGWSQKTTATDRPQASEIPGQRVAVVNFSNSDGQTIFKGETQMPPLSHQQREEKGNTPVLQAKMDVLPLLIHQIASASELQQSWKTPPAKLPNRPQKRALRGQIEAFGGMNLVNFHYTGRTDQMFLQTKNGAEHSGWGHAYGLQAGIVWKEKWLFSVGFLEKQYWSVLEYKQTKDIQVLKENQVLRILISTNGDTLKKIYGDTLIHAMYSRKVLHNNQYRQIAIPVELGFQRNKGRWSYAIRGGMSLNFNIAQQGKTINQDLDVVAFDGADIHAPFSSWDIGMQVSTEVGYKMTPGLILFLRPQYGWQTFRSNISGGDLSGWANQYNFYSGIRYTIK